MANTVSDYMFDRLEEWGVETIFGFPGDGINGIMGALDRTDDRFEFVQVRHEEMAAFMAGAFAKYSDGDTPGVCLATSGPGAIHLLNGLYDAKLDHQPVVAIIGQQARMGLGGSYQQEVDLTTLFKDVAGDYVQMVTVPEQMRHVIDRAFRTALSHRTVTCVIVPNDVQTLEAVESPPRKHGAVFSSTGFARPRVVPTTDDLERAAAILNQGERVAMLVGAGALDATEQVIEVAERLGAGVAKALLGKAVVPDDLPFVTGSIGLLGTKPSWDLMERCDTLLMVGSGFPYSEFLPKEGQARGVQIDIDPKMLSIRYPMELGLVGDSAATLDALIPLLDKKEDRSFQEEIVEGVARWWEVVETRAMTEGRPMTPQRPFWELSSRLPDGAIISADSGTAANWFARDIKIRRGMKASLSGNLATMGPGVPYTIAAKFAHPDRVAIGFVGDGAMQMLGINGLITAAKYYERWSDPRMVICVLHNNDLNQVTWEMRAMEGNPRYEASQAVPEFPYADYAEMLGLVGIKVEDPDAVGSAWDRSLAADRPVVLDVVTDPGVPTIPPNVTFEQAKNYATALLKGDPNAFDIVADSAREIWDAMFPRRS
ncbi:MAG: thiamine pyrophosphate-requiring protein [Acidimicrobiia bacterium]